jgi:hypothetical protein
MNRLQFTLLIALFALLEGCASTIQAKPETQSHFLEHNAQFGIPANAVVPHVHAGSKVNWSKYNKVQLKPILIDNGFASQIKGGDEEDVTRLTKSFYDMLSDRLSRDYHLVDEPAPDTMSIQLIIKHAESSWIAPQFLSKVSWQLQAVNSVVRYFRGKPAFAGEITIEFSVHDSVTGELLFAGTDRRVGGQNLFDKEALSSWGDARNSIKFWTEQAAYHLCVARRGLNCSQPKA